MVRLLPLLNYPYICSVLAQVSLPNPPYLPPNSSYGAQPSSNSSLPISQWTTLLGNLLYFYEAQRSGALPSTNRVSWRNSSATDDGNDVNLDLSGGYYDAGDYIKATFPLSFTLMSICWGAMDFGKGYDMANQTAYLDDMLRWGLGWLMKAHPFNSTLFVQIGDSNIDNEYWGGDQNIPTPRPSYQINDTSPGTDAAAGASAAFSACSSLYANHSFGSPYTMPASLQNSSYASILLAHAEQLYTFALYAKNGQKLYQQSVPEVADAYASSSYADELTIAALFLSLASNESSLFQDAANMYSKYSLGGQNDVFNWDSKTPAIAVLFAQISHTQNLSNATQWQDEAERYFDRIINKQGPGYMTGGGLLYYDGDSDEDSLNPSLNAAMLLARYAPIASTSDRRQSYKDFADAQLDYTLGKNPMSVPYIVGSNPNSPQNPHSAMASGGSDIGHIDTSPPQEAHVIYGAVVGGPDKNDKFWDIRSDWPQTEVALDYNAPLLTLTAMHVLNDTSDPYYTSLKAGAYDKVRPSGQPCDAAFSCSPGGLSRDGTIALAVVITVVGLVIMGGIAWYGMCGCCRGRQLGRRE